MSSKLFQSQRSNVITECIRQCGPQYLSKQHICENIYWRVFYFYSKKLIANQRRCCRFNSLGSKAKEFFVIEKKLLNHLVLLTWKMVIIKLQISGFLLF